MPTPKPADVDAYLAALPEHARAPLVEVRAAMRRALPGAEEAIKYGMPAYLVGGRAVASFAGWKAHWALYLVPTPLFEKVAAALPDHEANKGIVKFGLDEPMPEQVERILADWVAP
jgi:uncharacterized protein YdhG (YjbR/CyaY superfamily)